MNGAATHGAVRAFLVALVLATLGCEVGLPVVGDRPLTPPPASDVCFAVRCDEVLEPLAPRWEPGLVGADAAACAAIRPVAVSLDDPLAASRALSDMRCAEVSLEATAPFTLDLRNLPLAGARIALSSHAAGTVLLGGDVSRVDLSIDGPVEVRMEGGALGTSHVVLTGRSPARLASLTLVDVIVTDVVVDAPYGVIRARQSVLTRARLEPVEAALELSSLTNATLRASRVTLVDAPLRDVDLEVGSLVAAGAELDGVDVVSCDELALAVLRVRDSHVARCTHPLVLDDVDVDASLIEADLLGSARVRRSGLAGRVVSLDESRLTLVALCGVESLSVFTTSVECPSCEPAAPPEICGAPTTVQPYCPGFERSPCDGAPRPDPSGLVSAP